MFLTAIGPDRLSSPPRPWKVASANEIASVIPSGATIAVGWIGDDVAGALADGFHRRAEPTDLTIVYATTRGEARTRGLNRLAVPGLVRRVIGGQWQPVPALQALARAEQIEAYSLPVGVIQRLFRDIAAELPGHLTRSGLGTLTDPRRGGGRLNRTSRESLVQLVRMAGREALLFPTFPINFALTSVAFMSGSSAIAMTRDCAILARAAHASGGLVIAQHHRIGTLNRLPSDMVMVPDTSIDVLVAPEQQDRLLDAISSQQVWREPHGFGGAT